jgi:uncharacterized metal-binding protein YceD (DUF177 family)
MEALDQFSIPVSGLSDGLHTYQFVIESNFFEYFETSPIKEAQVDVVLEFDKRSDMYIMNFDITGTVVTTCDRCLEEFGLPVEDNQTLLVKFDEQESEDAEIIFILRGTNKLNVAKYIYEFINLAMPMAKTHDDAGESCNPEMLKFLKNLEEEEPNSSNPFRDALKDLNQEN